MDDMEILTALAKDIGEDDGGQPTGGDVAAVIANFNLPDTAAVQAIVRTHLVAAGEFLVAAQELLDEPLAAVSKHSDDRPSVAAADYWRQEFTDRAESLLQALLDEARRA